MTGHVFHPGHDEWHGQTVVVSTSDGRTVIGRWDSVAAGQVQMMDVAVHPASDIDDTRDEWVARLKKFGIPPIHRSFLVPETTVESVVRLRDA